MNIPIKVLLSIDSASSVNIYKTAFDFTIENFSEFSLYIKSKPFKKPQFIFTTSWHHLQTHHVFSLKSLRTPSEKTFCITDLFAERFSSFSLIKFFRMTRRFCPLFAGRRRLRHFPNLQPQIGFRRSTMLGSKVETSWQSDVFAC